MKLAPVNITNCDKEPIHLIDLIQPCGYQLIYNRQGKLVNYSDNLAKLYKDSAFPHDLKTLLSAAQISELLAGPHNAIHETILIDHKRYSIYAFQGGDSLVVEVEPVNEINANNPFLVSGFIRQLEQAEDIAAASLTLAKNLQSILDYDRIMIYAFDDDWNGYVVNEAVKPGVHSYFNHHFPASDIPMQAREMLLKTKTRQICDVAGSPVALAKPAEAVSFQMSCLRQPSEIHLQFLRNMQVHATITFAIVVHDKLWGLVCGQHESPLYKDAVVRTLCQNITSVFAQRIPYFNEKKDESRIHTASTAMSRLYEAGLKYDTLESAVQAHLPVMQQLVQATGIAMIDGEGIIIKNGAAPTDDQIQNIVEAIETTEDVFFTHRLSTHLPDAGIDASVASGIFYLQVSPQIKMIWFRPEIKLTRTWAGNPEKDITITNKGLQINPRKSFQAYVEKVKNTSARWTVTDIEIIKLLKKILGDLQLKLLFQESIDVRNALKTKIDKLSEISTIIAHDLKNPITNLQLLISLFEQESDADVPWLVSQLKNISHSLLDNVNNLSNLTELLAQQAIPKNQLRFEEILTKAKKQLEGQIISTSAVVDTDFDVERINYPAVYLESILSNLLSNAIKYKMPERPPHIKVKTTNAGDYIRLEVQDNGRGIPLSKGIDTFGLFKTFHNHPQARGIGIYITRSQVESLGGKMDVESTVGEGTRFVIHLKNFADA